MLGDIDQENRKKKDYRSTNMALSDQKGGTDQDTHRKSRVQIKKGPQIRKIEKIEGTDQPTSV